MKRQKQDLTTKKIKFFDWIKLLAITSAMLFMFSCSNDIDEIHALSNQLDLPNQSGKNIEVWYTDSGKLQLKFIAPLMSQYTKKEGGPYFEFVGGVEVLFFDVTGTPESKVTAGYAIYYEEKKLWEARDSVVARNLKTNEQLETEQLYWDLDKKLVYSQVFTKITNKDGVYYGESGFEATQDMKKYKLKGSSGTVNVKNDEVQ
jgi:LPS export ABC transporter protein LptC